MTTSVVGREDELNRVDEFLNDAAGPAALVLEGEAGIGKSTLWLAGVEAAREQGLLVLSSRPAEAERGLAHAGLGDLVEPVLEEVLPGLPPPRRRALEAALLLREPEGRLDSRAVAVAVRTALVALARERPLLVAIDDVQWLDPSSAAALAFALRRMEDVPLRLLLARRVGEGIEPSELEQVFEPAVTRVVLGPLSVGAIQQLLQARLERVFPRPTLLRLHELSGGNPFYALELARSLGADVDLTRPLPVPETLEGLVRTRLAGLPEKTREGLAFAAALGSPRVALLERVGVTVEVLAPAFSSHVVERSNGQVRFTHPLLAGVLEGDLSDGERRRIHGLLADVVEEPLARARHLALAADGPDAAIAAALEEAGRIALGRGAAITAAELAAHALRLTPPGDDDDLHRRTIDVARSEVEFGELERASKRARELLDGSPPGGKRAEALLLLAEAEGEAQSDTERLIALLREALAEAGGQPALQSRIHQRLAWSTLYTEAPAVREGHARASLELARAIGDEAAAASALGALAYLRHKVGEGDAGDVAAEAYETASRSGDADALRTANFARFAILVETGRFDEAREVLAALEREWGERSELVNALALTYASKLEFHAGNFGVDHFERRREIAFLYGRDDPGSSWDVAVHAAYRGKLEEAREIAERGRTEPVNRGGSEAALGFVELWSGRPASAVEQFATADEIRRETALREPHLYWWRSEHVEALLELGRVDEAEALLDAWEREAARLGRPRVLAHVMRGRGLVAAARGEVDEALSLLERARAQYEALGDRFGRARALLALGTLRRRMRQRRVAREAIEEALAGFEECGAEVFAVNARAELGSIGGRRREEGLTAAERRVADLVAEGKTNREVAAALFLGERTVATHLSHVYAKLGIRSRTELARTLEPGKVQQF